MGALSYATSDAIGQSIATHRIWLLAIGNGAIWETSKPIGNLLLLWTTASKKFAQLQKCCYIVLRHVRSSAVKTKPKARSAISVEIWRSKLFSRGQTGMPNDCQRENDARRPQAALLNWVRGKRRTLARELRARKDN